jgi:twitching motility protein PilT
VEGLALPTEGLILITGPNGSGRSATLAALIDMINRQRPVHILTLEDPIEFVHTGRQALISQREIGLHVRDLSEGIRAAMREDPDVIVACHPKQAEEFELLLRAAEAGRLVFAMLDTIGVVRTIERIIYSFPVDRHETLRSVLAGVLRGVLCQHLLQRTKGGRVPAIEILFGSPAVASVIREWRLGHLAGLMSISQGTGMQTMDDSLRLLLERNDVDIVEALEAAQDREELKRWLIGQRRTVPEE